MPADHLVRLSKRGSGISSEDCSAELMILLLVSAWVRQNMAETYLYHRQLPLKHHELLRLGKVRRKHSLTSRFIFSKRQEQLDIKQINSSQNLGKLWAVSQRIEVLDFLLHISSYRQVLTVAIL